MSILTEASLIITPNAYKAGTLLSVVPSSGAGDMDVARNSGATKTNSAGLIEGVAVNVPRIDYSNGSCPSLLVEPQRTNLASYSEQFDNVFWTSFETSISANATTSPDGATTADKIIDTTVNTIHANFKGFLISTESTLSYFVKSAEYSRVAISNLSDGGEAVFNLSTGAVVSTSSTWKNSTITALSNGWFRISATTNGVSGSKAIGIQLVNNSGALSFAGTGASGLYIWGAQLEAGSYPTSYIPTTSASVTRNADVISKTGISSLIGQTEGTMFVDIDFDGTGFSNTNDFFLYCGNGSNTNSMYIDYYNGLFRFVIFNASTLAFYADVAVSTGRNKLAIGYKAGQYVAYKNGSLVLADTSAVAPPATSIVSLGAGGSYSFSTIKKNTNSASLWKTRLTNTQLAQLTTL